MEINEQSIRKSSIGGGSQVLSLSCHCYMIMWQIYLIYVFMMVYSYQVWAAVTIFGEESTWQPALDADDVIVRWWYGFESVVDRLQS